MYNRTNEQKLVDIMFQVVSAAHFNPKWFAKATHEEKMQWVAEQLDGCGFPTTPVGASWGILKKDEVV